MGLISFTVETSSAIEIHYILETEPVTELYNMGIDCQTHEMHY